jgi:hypothetical protein
MLWTKEITRLKPTARDLARAYEWAFFDHFVGSAAHRHALRARLEGALVEEHVAAQQKMGRAVTWLNWVLVFLTVALVYFATFDYLHNRSTTPSDSATWAKWTKDFWEQGTAFPRVN